MRMGKPSFECCVSWRSGEDFLKHCKNVGYAEGFLQIASDTGTLCLFRRFNQLSRHVDQRGLATPCRGEEAFCGVFAIEMAAVLREIYIAEDGVRRALGKERQGFI